jgi:hypothetical protein
VIVRISLLSVALGVRSLWRVFEGLFLNERFSDMLSRWLVYCSLASVLCVSNGAEAAIIGFQSDYAPGNWAPSPETGSINTAGAPNSISLTSGNTTSGASNTDFTIVLTTAGALSFNWAYSTSDLTAPVSQYDPFGYLVNGSFTQLTVNGGSNSQNGVVNLVLAVNDVFGFRQRTIDNFGGSATTTISSFSGPGIGSPAAVPEPASAAALCLGSLALVVRRLRRRSSVVA